MKFFKNNAWLLLFIAFVLIFFAPIWKDGKLPIPSDALVGLYHPWRDMVRNQYPNGIPVKNYLITDPIRQQYPYRKLAIDQIKQGKMPLWNPYSFSGTPLLANIQTAVFYPLSVLFFTLEFENAWAILVMTQPLLAGIFLYMYLDHLGIDKRASFLGALSFAFSGFMMSWLEWNTLGHAALWLPLALLAKDQLVKRWTIGWAVILVTAEVSTLLAGHLQTAVYFFLFINVYLLVRLWQKNTSSILTFNKKLFSFLIKGGAVLLVTSFQLVTTFTFISSSAREFDLSNWQRPDWFIPSQHLFQFIVPDFFGNPSTGNYWGVWNYGEFVGYIGVIPLVLALFAIFFQRDKKTLFFSIALLVCFIFGFATPIGKLPYILGIPLISTMQPSRIMVLIDFCLAILAAFGFDYFLKLIKENTLKFWASKMVILVEIGIAWFVAVWLVVLFAGKIGIHETIVQHLDISKRNLILPTGLFCIFATYVILNIWKRKEIILKISTVLLLFVVFYDLARFGLKYNAFTERNLLFPETEVTKFLQNNLDHYRYMSTDRRIIPPNVSTYYKLQSVDGYDPLYLRNYGELVAAWGRNSPDISPVAFNRILTPENVDSFLTDLLGVKYILSLNPLAQPKLKLVFQEGETRVYENNSVFPRAFLAAEIKRVSTKQEVIEEMFSEQKNLSRIAIMDYDLYVKPAPLSKNEFVTIETYQENYIKLNVVTDQERLLVLTDIYYPDWKVFINGHESSIFLVDYVFRGTVVPKGESVIEFKIT